MELEFPLLIPETRSLSLTQCLRGALVLKGATIGFKGVISHRNEGPANSHTANISTVPTEDMCETMSGNPVEFSWRGVGVLPSALATKNGIKDLRRYVIQSKLAKQLIVVACNPCL